MIHIRPEQPIDRERVFAVNEAAFGQRGEADLVEALRESTEPLISLVAEVDGAIVGHVLFSPVAIEGEGAAPACGALGPVAVHPDHQRRGMGSALIRDALTRCGGLGWKAIFVLGDPAYYARFGFALAAPLGFHYASVDFDPAFQVLEIRGGALEGCGGWVRYADAFGAVDG